MHFHWQGGSSQRQANDNVDPQIPLDWVTKFGPWGLMAFAIYFGCKSAGNLLVGIGERFLLLSTQFAHDVKEGMERIEAAIRSQELKVAVLQERIERIDNELNRRRNDGNKPASP